MSCSQSEALFNMAMEKVGEAVLSSCIGLMIEKMVSEFTNFFKTQKMDMRLLERLKMLANTASGVLDDAEHKQFTAPAVKDWLVEYKDVAYEADILLDLIAYEATAREIEDDQRNTAASQPGYVFPFRNPFKKARVDRSTPDIPKRMEEIVERFELLLEQIDQLGLEKSGRKDAWPQREPTTSVVDESEIFGRDVDRDRILNLLGEDGVDGNAIGVIPIVGMGGIGKTTLAQYVYNHSKAQEFESRAWVCVSDNYDGFRIKKELLKQVGDSGKCDDWTPEQIDVALKKSLKDKKYLLVLDDIWDENWDRLQAPLKSGARGSKIIITTRNQNIASKMGTVASGPYELRDLDADSCRQFFEKRAFKGGKGDQRFESIGKEIVSKCKGLPLATKMLGDLLRGEQKVAKWQAILESDLWELRDNKVLPALMLSYQHLPSYLKRCFAYCAIFPKDYRMRKEEVIQLWMTEGFLVQPIRGKKMEEFGEECFDELVSRSFLQKPFNEGVGSSFCMHDLINDLAQHISGEFIVRMEEDRSNKIGNKTRHFSSMASKLVLENISEDHKLRTFLCLRGIANEVLPNEILKLRYLRALSLHHFYKMVELPDQIGDLKLLRYLNLAGTSVERLPDSVCTLYNLQTLILYCCDKLVELPKNIGSLINLHCLDIRYTRSLKEMPLGMGNLEELRTLCKFIVGKQNGSGINQLGKLHYLRGELSIYDLQNVVDTTEEILKNKKHLEDLKLVWSSETEDAKSEDDSEHDSEYDLEHDLEHDSEHEHDRRVLKGLQPCTSINKLSIRGYRATKFADWVGHSSYTNIVSLELKRCRYCTSLPPLEQLSSLEHLSISNCDAVVQVSMKTPFCSLKTLEIEFMRQWEEWIFCEGNDSVKCGSLAKLEKLTIRECPELKSITTCGRTHEIFKSLYKLEVRNCPNFKTSNLIAISNFSKIPNSNLIAISNFDKIPERSYSSEVILKLLPSATYGLSIVNIAKEGIEEMGIPFNALEDIKISKSELSECIPLEECPKLKSLDAEDCKNLKSLTASAEPLHQPLTLLASLKIEQCPSLIFFPKAGIAAPNLTRLELSECSNLKSLPEGMHVLLPSLQHLLINFCDKIESFPEGGLPANLQSLEIRGCDKLIGGRLQWGLQRLNALSRLCLSQYKGDDLDSFPEETLLPSTLTSLQINEFYSLKVINYKGLQHLTSLAELKIRRCLNLQCLPKEGLPSSLSFLRISGCRKLQSFPEGGLPLNLQSLDIGGCNKLIGGRLQWGLQRLNALSRLCLSWYKGDDLDSFPEETLLPSTLTSLEISKFYSLKVINYKGLQHLTSLAELEIWLCPNLQCLPEQGLPSSLSRLRIYSCPILKERCEREKGEDWPKISHISHIQIWG